MTANSVMQTLAPRQASSEAVIKCAGLVKVFRDFWLRNRVLAVGERVPGGKFKGIDLEVRRGEVFGLLGPNGSGKSTTIKMILGLLHPTAGRVVVLNKRPEDVATKKEIGYLPEESYLYRFLNARETLDYYGRLFHMPRDLRKRRIDQLLEMVGLEGAQRRPVGEYSKGMQRRIGLAQALINDPQLLILDEPTTGLDPIGSRQIRDLILELSRRGKTILLCSHLLSDVEDVCHRVAIMFGGRVRREGTIDELLVKQEITTLQADSLDEDTINQVEKVLANRGRRLEKVTHPRQRLEDLFLDIVKAAHDEGASTTGARNTGQVAEFLRSEREAEGQELIQELTAAPKKPEPTAAPAAEAPRPAPAQQVLAELAQPKAAPAKPAGPVKPTEDASVLADLVQPTSGTTPPAPNTPRVAPAPPKAAAAPAVPPPQPKPATPPAKPAPSSEEAPDASFIDALTKVPPFKAGDEKGGSGNSGGTKGSA